MVVATAKPQIALHVASRAVIVKGKRSREVSVSEAAEFLVRERVRGQKKAQRHEEDEEDDGLGF